MSYNGTVRCRYCYEKGHNVRGCEKLQAEVKANVNGYYHQRYAKYFDSEGNKLADKSSKSCSYCKNTGHTKRTCETKLAHFIHNLNTNAEYRKDWLDFVKSKGLGIGSLVFFHGNQYLVTEINYENVYCGSGSGKHFSMIPVSEHSYYKSFHLDSWSVRHFDSFITVDSCSQEFPEPSEEWKKGGHDQIVNFTCKIENPFRSLY